MYIFYYFFRLGFISQWGALAGRYAALCPPGWPWAAHRMPLHSPNGMCFLFYYNLISLCYEQNCAWRIQYLEYILIGNFIFEANWEIQNI